MLQWPETFRPTEAIYKMYHSYILILYSRTHRLCTPPELQVHRRVWHQTRESASDYQNISSKHCYMYVGLFLQVASLANVVIHYLKN